MARKVTRSASRTASRPVTGTSSGPPPPDVTAPTILTSATQSVAENSVFSIGLSADESVTWTKTGGADAALFTLAGATLSMAAKDFEVPTDANTDNAYIVQVTATDAALNATAKTITVTVTDVSDTGYTFTNAEASAYVAAMTSVPDNTRKGVIDTLVGALKANGTSGTNKLAKLDVLSLFAAHDAQAANLNLINPAKAWVPTNSPVFTIDRGYAGDAASKHCAYADTWAALTNYTQNDGAHIVGVRSSTLGATNWWIGANGASSGSGLNAQATLCIPRVNNTAAGNGAVLASSGRFTTTRNGTTTVSVYVNGVFSTSVVTASIAKSTNNPATHRNNTSHSDAQISFVAIGAGFNAAEAADFDAAIAAYLTAVGA